MAFSAPKPSSTARLADETAGGSTHEVLSARRVEAGGTRSNAKHNDSNDNYIDTENDTHDS